MKLENLFQTFIISYLVALLTVLLSNNIGKVTNDKLWDY